MKTLAAIQSFIQSRKSKRLKPKTIEWYQTNLSKFAASCPELPTEPEPIEQFLLTIPGEVETVHGHYRSIKALYRFICRRHRLLNPMDVIDSPQLEDEEKVRPTLTALEMLRLLSQPQSLRDKAILTLLIDTGVRATELANLRKADIGEDTILVTGKRRQREVPISEETRRLIFGLVSQDGVHDYVFRGERGKLTRSGIYRLVRHYLRKAGIEGPKLGPHRIRHGFAAGYLVNGGDLYSLQQILGHRKITTTQIYLKLSTPQLVAKHRASTPLRSTHAAAQATFDTSLALKEAEAILVQKRNESNDNKQSL